VIPLLLALPQVLSADTLYSLTELGSLGYGYGINNAGQVTGISFTPTGTYHAFLYSNGQMLDLGTLGGPTSQAYGINDAGQVTGTADAASGAYHAFLYSNGQMMDLAQLPHFLGRSVETEGLIRFLVTIFGLPLHATTSCADG
jgi:probable HAF family extracellular repeat protein